MYEELVLKIAKTIGVPVNPSLNTPVEVSALANLDEAEPGEHVYRYDAQDTDADEILDVATSTGVITAVKTSPVADTLLTFKHLNSKKQYVLVPDVMDSPDTTIFSRKKERIIGALDKLELRMILNAIIDGKTPGMVGGTHALEDAIAAVLPESADDIYDIIFAMKHAVEDYGNDYLLLCGSTIKEKIDTYDKDYADTWNYNVGLLAKLKELGIDVMKIFGTVKWTGGAHNIGSGGYADDSAVTALLDANKMIFMARNTRIGMGKPITFVRRKISPAIAKMMGAEIDAKTYRAIFVDPAPTQVAGTEVLGFGVYGYESIIWFCNLPNAIIKSGDLSSYLHA